MKKYLSLCLALALCLALVLPAGAETVFQLGTTVNEQDSFQVAAEKFAELVNERTNGEYTKGIVIHDTFEAAKQGYHAYLGAYAYGHDANTDYVSCMITDMSGMVLTPFAETWEREAQAEE